MNFESHDLEGLERERDEDLEVAGEIEGRDDVVQTEEEDEDLSRQDGEGEQGGLLARRGEHPVDPAEELDPPVEGRDEAHPGQGEEREEPAVLLLA